jgi:hypothetical protein
MRKNLIHILQFLHLHTVMAFINDMEIAELQKTLTTREAAGEILANFLPLLRNLLSDVPHSNAYNRREDRLTSGLLPEEFGSWIPLSSRADGNCLFHSASILLIGNETLSGILRLLTVSELFAHSDFYGDHPQVTQFAQASGYSQAAIFSILLSDDLASDVYAGNSDNAPHAIESLAKTSAKPYVFSSQFHVLALASVICLPIFSVYPDIPGCTAIKNALHCVCYPREGFLENSSLNAADPVHIMWTRANISPLRGWTPNHFAPLIPFRKLHHSTSFEDVVRRGRKKVQKFSFEKSDGNQENLTDKKHLEQTSLPNRLQQQRKIPIKQQQQKTLPINQQVTPRKKQQQQTTVPIKRQQQKRGPIEPQQQTKDPMKSRQQKTDPMKQQQQK